MSHATLLAAFAVALRGTGSLMRATTWPTLGLVGGVLSLVATWAVGGLLGAWFPLWPAVALGLAVGIALWRLEDLRILAAADALLILLMSGLSVPSLALTSALLLLVVLAPGWSLVEFVAHAVPARARAVLLVLGLMFLEALAFRNLGPGDPLVATAGMVPWLGVSTEVGSTACGGDRVELETGSVAWLDEPGGAGPGPGALLLHGANPQGSQQPAACVLRRALVDAGFVVLSLDHPGYGQSPAPAMGASAEAWDPAPARRAALDRLRSHRRVETEIVVGHSMGGTEALRLLSENSDLAGAVLLAASPAPDAGSGSSGDRRYERFHRDRGLEGRIPREVYDEISRRYYGIDPDSVPPGAGLITFGTFGHEWDNVRQIQQTAYPKLPEPKREWRFPDASHYLSAFSLSGLIVGDTRVTRSVTRVLREYREALAEGERPASGDRPASGGPDSGRP